MRFNLTIILFMFPLFYSCSKTEETKINAQKKQTCSAVFGTSKKVDFGQNISVTAAPYISNGKVVIDNEVLGANSTVLVRVGSMDCSGVVISKSFVLTAAHCFFPNKNEVINLKTPDHLAKIIINNNINNTLQSIVINIDKTYINPLYNANLGSSNLPLGDIALLKTSEPLNLPSAQIAYEPNEGEKVISIGYGFTSKFKTDSGGVKRWTFSTASHPTPLKAYPEFDINRYQYAAYNNYVNSNVAPNVDNSFFIIKRYNQETEGQTCNGDSGGPQFVFRNNKIALISITQGITSLLQGQEALDILQNEGDDCNQLTTSVNTRVAPYFKWLNTQMEAYGENLYCVD